jgi:hypothetical protein
MTGRRWNAVVGRWVIVRSGLRCVALLARVNRDAKQLRHGKLGWHRGVVVVSEGSGLRRKRRRRVATIITARVGAMEVGRSWLASEYWRWWNIQAHVDSTVVVDPSVLLGLGGSKFDGWWGFPAARW